MDDVQNINNCTNVVRNIVRGDRYLLSYALGKRSHTCMTLGKVSATFVRF
jgi:hypothetical protein